MPDGALQEGFLAGSLWEEMRGEGLALTRGEFASLP
jgi:hypothetical protein